MTLIHITQQHIHERHISRADKCTVALALADHLYPHKVMVGIKDACVIWGDWRRGGCETIPLPDHIVEFTQAEIDKSELRPTKFSVDLSKFKSL